jgi:hypothetical protein
MGWHIDTYLRLDSCLSCLADGCGYEDKELTWVEMRKLNSESRNLPSVQGTGSYCDDVDVSRSHRMSRSEDIVDAEFREADDLGPAWCTSHQAPQKPQREWGSLLLRLCSCAGTAAYYFFGAEKKAAPKTEWPVGWAELIDCYSTTSLDGKRELELSEDQHAVLHDKTAQENGKYRAVHGDWSFDPITKQYAITLNGATTSYSLVEPEHAACMLIKGGSAAANLNESWFATYDNEAPDYGRSYEEAHEPH